MFPVADPDWQLSDTCSVIFHITDSYNRQLCVYLYMFPLCTFFLHFVLFSDIYHFSLLRVLYFLCPGHFVRVVCTQVLPSTLFRRKNSSPFSESYIFVSWLLRKSSLHTGSSFHVIPKKELFSSHPVNNRWGSGFIC